MEAIRQTQKRYCSAALSFAILAGFAAYLLGWVPVCKGLILGTLFSILNFILMGEILPMQINRSKKKLYLIAVGSFFGRFLLLAIPIGLAITHKQYDLIATGIGVFMVQLMLLGDHIRLLIKERYHKAQ